MSDTTPAVPTATEALIAEARLLILELRRHCDDDFDDGNSPPDPDVVISLSADLLTRLCAALESSTSPGETEKVIHEGWFVDHGKGWRPRFNNYRTEEAARNSVDTHHTHGGNKGARVAFLRVVELPQGDDDNG